MVREHATYSAALAEANRRAREVGIEVAIRQQNGDGVYVLQQRWEMPPADTKLVAVARPE